MPFEWGSTFGGSVGELSTNNLLDHSCELSSGKPVCCSIFKEFLNIGASLHHESSPAKCFFVKEYIPSSYESQQFVFARFLDGITDDRKRQEVLIDYIVSESNLNASWTWLDRVSKRMKYPSQYAELPADDIDREYLSRFFVTRVCHNRANVS